MSFGGGGDGEEAGGAIDFGEVVADDFASEDNGIGDFELFAELLQVLFFGAVADND